MKTININGVDYTVFNSNEGIAKPQPHIVETLSGNVPESKRLGLLREYLKQNGIEPINGATTYWCIDKVLTGDVEAKDDQVETGV